MDLLEIADRQEVEPVEWFTRRWVTWPRLCHLRTQWVALRIVAAEVLLELELHHQQWNLDQVQQLENLLDAANWIKVSLDRLGKQRPHV